MTKKGTLGLVTFVLCYGVSAPARTAGHTPKTSLATQSKARSEIEYRMGHQVPVLYIYNSNSADVLPAIAKANFDKLYQCGVNAFIADMAEFKSMEMFKYSVSRAPIWPLDPKKPASPELVSRMAVFIDMHGNIKDGKSVISYGVPRKPVAVDELISNLADRNPSTFVYTCHSGAIDNRKSCIGSACGSGETCLTGDPTADLILDLMCAAYGSKLNCEKWWEVDTDGNGLIDKPELVGAINARNRKLGTVSLAVSMDACPERTEMERVIPAVSEICIKRHHGTIAFYQEDCKNHWQITAANEKQIGSFDSFVASVGLARVKKFLEGLSSLELSQGEEVRKRLKAEFAKDWIEGMEVQAKVSYGSMDFKCKLKGTDENPATVVAENASYRIAPNPQGNGWKINDNVFTGNAYQPNLDGYSLRSGCIRPKTRVTK